MNHDFGVNQGLVEEQFLRWAANPFSVDEAWRNYFDQLPPTEHPRLTSAGTVRAPVLEDDEVMSESRATNGNGVYGAPALAKEENEESNNTSISYVPNGSNGHSIRIPYTAPPAEVLPFLERRLPRTSFPPTTEMLAATQLQGRVSALVHAYRVRGHLFADLDPLGLAPKPEPELELENFGLAQVTPETVFAADDIAGPSNLPLSAIVERLKETYCRTIGVEFAHIEESEERKWLQQRMEATCNRLELTKDEQLRILSKLTDAENFEQFLHTNYMGAKRFSLEGAESVIPMLDMLVDLSADQGVEEVVIGMAHRGRLNVLANIMEMNLRDIFAAFEDGNPEDQLGRGDVKYHLGFSSDHTAPSGKKIHLTLSFNPSHLEFVNPVVEGRVRAKQDRRGDTTRSRVLPLVIHGDAAFIGQGVVAETLNLSRLRGYHTGGTIHVVINNQIGFTTSPKDDRSTWYCTDITRMLRSLVFHVNGEDPESVAQVVRLATEYRQKFQRDVVIDLYCYRKYGHNEADEPRYTQPVMYAAIDKKKSVREVYVERLVEMGKITHEQAAEIQVERRRDLETALADMRTGEFVRVPDTLRGIWDGYRGGPDPGAAAGPETSVSRERLETVLNRICELPSDFTPNRKVLQLLKQRRDRALTADAVDWGTGEWLALGTLLREGTRVRLTGQDTCRGTFSHRHAVLFDALHGTTYTPLQNLSEESANLEIHDSPLSEAGCLGFEYGYSLDSPDMLVMWEAQFGDFGNVAQVIIDQFISSSEDKWHRLSGIVLLLPHGFEGQGPEHSSARLERFLSLAAEDNVQVCNLTTPAQYFHCLRRQILSPWRKPLVIMTPKSLLRHPRAISSLKEFSEGRFQRIIPDNLSIDPKQARRVILCSGKVYYDLIAAREERKIQDIALIRVEQLAPFLGAEYEQALAQYPSGTDLVWVQEEPWNMGGWFFMNAHLPDILNGRFRLRCVSRPASASPATGSLSAHNIEQKKLISHAFE